jgi:hypothetical protein
MGLALLHAEAKQAVRHQAQATDSRPAPAEALAKEPSPDGLAPAAHLQSDPSSSEPAEQKQQISQKASLPAEPEDKRINMHRQGFRTTSSGNGTDICSALMQDHAGKRQ